MYVCMYVCMYVYDRRDPKRDPTVLVTFLIPKLGCVELRFLKASVNQPPRFRVQDFRPDV